ncbi:lysylphosphatidylglycerol synthase transmembrane domain-containing protein [Haloarchaeobius sp. HME9146]|uniref:lysylphosphatidylglycerol synthase transmembrane domain-containing protein n=1 Tax=Haloarchaeobius sp. HME9146 TaxID=2978732 RepID=UPI0021BFFBA5|nr:flippase-like domain-containing protein [Haloarchaeobius sp. HME9146]
MKWRRYRGTIVGFLAAGLVFAVMFWFLDARAVFAAAQRADPGLLAMVAGAILLWNLSWGVVFWQVLSAVDAGASLPTAVVINAAGAFANHVTPFGQAGGEPVTAWFVTRRTGTEYEVSLAAVASFDAINVIPSLTLALLGGSYYLSSVPIPFDLPGGKGVVAALGMGVLGVVLVWQLVRTQGARLSNAIASAVRFVTSRIPGVPTPEADAIRARIHGFVAAVRRVAGDRRRLTAAIAFSALGWTFQAVGLWVAFLALDAPIPVAVALFVVPLSALGSAFPTPGGLGGIEAISITLVTLFTGVAAPTIAAAVTIHSVGGYMLTTSIGAAATAVIGIDGEGMPD